MVRKRERKIDKDKTTKYYIESCYSGEIT